ncbi:OsmC family protein [Rudanella lutea]|uniref:OsmC family protein n=1 Tax=Rudanella lutea TaxID=451374 RepID=UPI00037C11C2|nr:OsmC family protein [Rudanella lutea]
MTVTARIEQTPYETHISTDTQVIVCDEPAEVGGGDKGMKPGDLLAASLGACTVITLRMYADRKGWPMTSAVAHVDLENDPLTQRAKMHMRLIINGNLTEEQRERLLEIADRCPVHRILENPIDFSTTLVR